MKKEYKVVLSEMKNSQNEVCCDVKEVLDLNPKLIIFNKDDCEIYRCDNIQTLYLYPLTIMDYINNLSSEDIIFMNIIEIDANFDYEKMFNSSKFKMLKNVEILIKEKYSDEEIHTICKIIKYLAKRNIKVSLNIKGLNKISNMLIDYFKYIIYFKIFLPPTINSDDYNVFLDKLALINKKIHEDALIHIKTFLKLDNVSLYEKMICDFSKNNVDVFQVSKELIPLDSDNIDVDKKYQDIIRKLEHIYAHNNGCRFISVKNLTTLYYPRFELCDKNSKKCYAARMKPYLYKDRLIPCKVSNVLSNLDDWSLNYADDLEYERIIEKCGLTCNDCASIFENDLLHDVERISTEKNAQISIRLVKV